MFHQINAAAPEILKSAAGAALALIAAAILAALKKRIFGGWEVEVTLEGVTLDSEPLSPQDAEKMLLFHRPWWWVLLIGGDPALKKEREVRQILQSAVTPYGNVTGDPRDATTVDATRRRLVVSLQDGVNFQRRGNGPPKPVPAPVKA